MRISRPALVAALVVTCLGAPAPAPASEPVRSADRFVDSIGVNVHMTYGDTAYRNRTRLIETLQEAGIRHVRDGLSYNTQYAYDAFNDLARRGIRTTFIMGDPSERHDTLEELLGTLKTKVPAAAEAVEGPNEYSLSGDPQWAANLRAYQERLYQAVNGDPALNHLPVLAPSLVWNRNHYDLGTLTSALDFGNKHPYPGGDLPEGNIQAELAMAGNVSGDRSVYVTESGYHNALATTSGHRPISEEGAATYLPRMYLEYFRRGVPRTFAYELIDEWPDPEKKNSEANFGLLRNDYSKKPAFRSLENLIALLSDTGRPDDLTPLDFTIPDAPADLRKLVLQKRDGTHYVVLWRAVRVWDPVARKAVAVDPRPVTLHLSGAAAEGRRAEIFSPSTSAHRLGAAAASGGIPVLLGADPMVIKLPPREPAVVPQAPPHSVLTVPPAQRVEQALRGGLKVRCWSNRAPRCRVAALRRGVGRGTAVIGKGGRALRPRESTRLRLRINKRGRKLLRRAAKRRRPVVLKVLAEFGEERVTMKRVRLRR